VKTAALILGVLGGLAAAALGMKWVGDFGQITELQRAMAQAAGEWDRLQKLGTAGLLLMAGGVAGIVGAVFAARGRFALGGGLMLAGGVIPLFWASQAVIATFLLATGGVVALAAHRKAVAVRPA
jgi:hypothetical protein